MRKTILTVTTALALGTATIATGAVAAPHGMHAGGARVAGHGGGGWRGGGGGWHGRGWAPGVALGLGLGGLYAYGGYPYGYCNPYYYPYNCNYYYGW